MISKLIRIVIFLALLSSFLLAAKAYFFPPSRYERIALKELEPVMNSEAAHLRYDSVKATLSAYAFGHQLVHDGVKRMDDENQLIRARLLTEMATASDQSACASLFTGHTDSARTEKSLELLSDQELREWGKMSAKAAELELQGSSTPPISEARFLELMQNYLGRLGGSDGERLQKILVGMSGDAVPSESDLCWAVKAFYGHIGLLSASDGGSLLRYMSGGR